MEPKSTKIWKVAAVFFGGFAVLFAGFLVFLPRTYLVSRPVLVEATPQQAYAVVSDLATWPTWAVWFGEIDETLQLEVTGEGTQQVLSFESAKLGGGTFKVTELKPGVQITLEAEVGEQGSAGLHRFQFEDKDGKTLVVWSMMGQAGDGLLSRLTVGTREQLAVRDFDDSLARLKACLEAGACHPGQVPR